MPAKDLKPNFEINMLNSSDYNKIIGIDEVGRGCWAGPVFVGAYIFTKQTEIFTGVRDSKMLTKKKREALYTKLNSKEYKKIIMATPEQIDKHGITTTIEILIWKIINEFNDPHTFFLVDGRFSSDFGSNTIQALKGDSKYYSIAAASILAKVERDFLMDKFNKMYPGYGFDKHKGYGTKMHQVNLRKNGICKIHRKSYKPIKLFT